MERRSRAGTGAGGLGGRALIAIAVTLLAWASAFIAIRQLAAVVDPGALALGRMLVASLALGVACLVTRGWVWPTPREWLLLVGCGLSWFAGYMLLLNLGERLVDAGTAAMLVNTGPIFLAVLAGLFLGERLTRWAVIGLAVAFGGALLIGWASRHSPTVDARGVLLCLGSAVLYALGMIWQKPVLRRVPSLQTTFLCCAVAAVALLGWSGPLVRDVARHPWQVGASIAYLGLVPTAAAFGTWAYALARTDAARLGVTTYIVPPLTIVLSWLVLHEVPPPLAVLGGVVCLVGVAVSRRRSRPRPASGPAAPE